MKAHRECVYSLQQTQQQQVERRSCDFLKLEVEVLRTSLEDLCLQQTQQQQVERRSCDFLKLEVEVLRTSLEDYEVER